MSAFQRIQNLILEPPPDYLFEITENSLSAASPSDPAKQRQEILSERAAFASPSAPNMRQPQVYREALARIAAMGKNQKRVTAALVIPDYAVRMGVLEFEAFPAPETERLALLRFRLRKTVPFPIDEAQLSYSIQRKDTKQVEVLAVSIARPILNEYEELLSEAGYRVGVVLPSSLAALRLCPDAESGLTILAKIAGSTLSVLLIDAGHVRIVRCIDLAGEAGSLVERDEHSVMPLLQQTMAYSEDQLGQPATLLLLAGFGPDTELLGSRAERELGIGYAPLRSKYGTASQVNAGLLGLLERYAA